jgi:neopullulanase
MNMRRKLRQADLRLWRAFNQCVIVLCLSFALPTCAHAQEKANPNAPVVKKVEPPNWWVGLTPDVMLLLSGKNLEATHANCNLADVIVSRTQSSGGGDYLFVWLKFGANLKSGTAICRITTPKGQTSFELPIAARTQILGRNQGIGVDDVIYLAMPDRFANGDPTNDEPAGYPGSPDRAKPRAYHGGDLRGVRDHLAYLSDLGVTAVWLTPVVANGAPQDYHGYGAVDLYAVDPHLGSLGDYRELVKAAHEQHLKVLFDVVPNHVGPAHPWVAHPPTPDWLHAAPGQPGSEYQKVKENFYGKSGKKEDAHELFELLEDPHTPPELRRNVTDSWFFGTLPDLNTENPLVVQYLVQNSVWWAESSGLDGYRVDTFPYVARTFWAQWHAGLRKIYPRLSTIGEVYHPDPAVTSFFQGGRKGWDGIDTGVTTVFDYPLYFALRDVLLNGTPAGRLADILRQDSLYPHPSYLVPFFGNHDVARFASAPGGSPAKLKLAFGLVLTMRGIPEMYYGDEIAMAGGGDPDNRRDFPGGWIGDTQNAFLRSGRTREQQEIFDFVRTLLHLRREHPALRDGKLWHLASDDSSYVYMRETEEEKVVIAFHDGTTPRDLSISLRDTPGQDASGIAPLFGAGQVELSGKEMRLHLPEQSFSIFVLQ